MGSFYLQRAESQVVDSAVDSTSRAPPAPETRNSTVQMIGSDVCAQCGKADAKKRCSQCKCVFYCSADCQRAAWPDHKTACMEVVAGNAPAAQAAVPPPPRGGGSWDDVSERQLLLALSEDELARREQLLSNGGGRTPLLAALSYGIKVSHHAAHRATHSVIHGGMHRAMHHAARHAARHARAMPRAIECTMRRTIERKLHPLAAQAATRVRQRAAVRSAGGVGAR